MSGRRTAAASRRARPAVRRGKGGAADRRSGGGVAIQEIGDSATGGADGRRAARADRAGGARSRRSSGDRRDAAATAARSPFASPGDAGPVAGTSSPSVGTGTVPGGAFFVAPTLRPIAGGSGALLAAGAGARADGDRPAASSDGLGVGASRAADGDRPGADRPRGPDARGDVAAGPSSGRGGGARSGPGPVGPLFQPLDGGPLEPAGAIAAGMQWLLAALGGLAALVLGVGLFAAWRTRRGERRRRALLDDIGLLQTALLPPVADQVGGLSASVAYRPWDGPGAGGDFYDVFPLPGGRSGMVLGDVEGHGRRVIGATAALRHSLRAYLEAGLEPRAALELAGEVLGRDPAASLATAVLAVHDPRTGLLTWAGAGHPPPILVGGSRQGLVTVAGAPPLGASAATGLRQTTVALPRGSSACFFTDGLIDARVGARRLGLDRLTALAQGLGTRLSASALLDAVEREASEITDDMAVCVLRPAADATADGATGRPRGRIEELALPPGQVSTSLMQRFLWACGVDADEALAAMGSARETARRGSGVLLRVETEGRAPVEVSELDRATLAPVS